MRKSWGEKRNLERVLGEGGFSLSSLWRGVENGTLPLPLPQSLKPSGRSSNRLSPEGEAGSPTSKLLAEHSERVGVCSLQFGAICGQGSRRHLGSGDFGDWETAGEGPACGGRGGCPASLRPTAGFEDPVTGLGEGRVIAVPFEESRRD